LLRGDHRHHHPKSFIADKDLNLKDKEDEVSKDDNTVQISNVSHLDVTTMDTCPIHPTGNHKRGEYMQNPDNQSVKRGTLQPMPADMMNPWLHQMTKRNFDGTTDWATAFFNAKRFSKEWRDTKEVRKSQGAMMSWLFIWKQQSLQSHLPW
jgi:hypothetical protein